MKKAASGIVMLKDLRPDLPVELAEVSAPARSAANPTSASQPTPVEEEEPPPPVFSLPLVCLCVVCVCVSVCDPNVADGSSPYDSRLEK